MKNDEILIGISENIVAIQANLFSKASAALHSSIFPVTSLSETKSGINVMGWCGDEVCGHKIEEATEMAVLGEPVGLKQVNNSCIVCGKSTQKTIYAAKT